MKWNIKKTSTGFLVKGPYGSFRQDNKYDAKKLCGILNNYEKNNRSVETMQRNFKEADKQLKQSLMSLNILSSDMNKLKRKLNNGRYVDY